MVDVKPVIRRPVPVEDIAVEVLASREQSLDHECGLDEIAAVVILSEEGDRSTRIPIEEMRPNAVKAIGARKKARDLQYALRHLAARREAAFRGDEHRHDAEAAAAERE